MLIVFSFPVGILLILRCVLHPMTKPDNHQEYHAKQLNTSNAMKHIRIYHDFELKAMQKCQNEGEDLDKCWIGLLVSLKPPEKPLDHFFTRTRVTTTKNGVKISNKLRKELSLLVWSIDSQLSYYSLESKHFKQFQVESNIEI